MIGFKGKDPIGDFKDKMKDVIDNLDEEGVRAIAEDLLVFDPIDAAEKVTGISGSEETQNLGLGLFIQSSALKGAALKEGGDTHFGIKYNDFKKLIVRYGFEELASINFEDDSSGDIRNQSAYYDKNRNVVLICDDCTGALNSANIYFSLSNRCSGVAKSFSPFNE